MVPFHSAVANFLLLITHGATMADLVQFVVSAAIGLELLPKRRRVFFNLVDAETMRGLPIRVVKIRRWIMTVCVPGLVLWMVISSS